MIPKTIHFCWLSNEPYPLIVRYCMRRWRQLLPDYTFKLWDTGSFNVSSVAWVKEAYERKKYAFAADYIRAYALYKEGGFYLDSDILLQQGLDNLLDNDFVSCVECYYDVTGRMSDCGLQAAFLGSIPGHPYLRDVLDYYEPRHFISADGSLNTMTIAPEIYANIALDYGFAQKDEKQCLKNGMCIYPSTFCAPNRDVAGRQSVAIHLCEHSWHDNVWYKRIAHRFRGFSRMIRIYISAWLQGR